MWDDDERYYDEEHEDWNVEDLCQQEFNPDNYYDDAIEAMQYAEPVVVSEEEMEQCLIESALAWTEEMSEEEIAAHNEAADRAYKERLRRQEERLEEDKIYFGKLREEKAKKRELEQQKIAEFAAERKKLTTVHPSNPLAAAVPENTADCKKNDCFASECGDKNAEERCDENSKENDVETPVVTEVCLACHVDKSDDVSGASVQELNTERKENGMVESDGGLTDGNDQDTDSKENNVETSASAEVRSTTKKSKKRAVPVYIPNASRKPITNPFENVDVEAEIAKTRAEEEKKKKAEEEAAKKKAEKEKEKAREKLLDKVLAETDANIKAAMQDAIDKKNRKRVKTEEELQAEAKAEEERKAREAEIDAKNAAERDQEYAKKEFPKTPLYSYDCDDYENEFFGLLNNRTQKEDRIVVMAGYKHIAVSAYGFANEKVRKFHVEKCWETDLYYTPNVFVLPVDEDGNTIVSTADKYLHAVRTFAIDVDYRNHTGRPGPHDGKDPWGFSEYMLEDLEGVIPMPNAIEYGNCFRWIYILKEPVYVGTGDSILRMIRHLQNYICQVILEVYGITAEPQAFSSFYRMPGSINTKNNSVVHVEILNPNLKTAQEICTKYLPELPMNAQEYAEHIKKVKKERKDGKSYYHGRHTVYVLFRERMDAYLALAPYIQRGHREAFLHHCGVAYLYLKYGNCSELELFDFLLKMNAKLPDPLTTGEIRGSFRTLIQGYAGHKYKNETICREIGVDLDLINALGLKGLFYKTSKEKAKEAKQAEKQKEKRKQAKKDAYETKQAKILQKLVPLYISHKFSRKELCVILGITLSVLERLITRIRKELAILENKGYNRLAAVVKFLGNLNVLTRENVKIDEILVKDGKDVTDDLYAAIVKRNKRKPKKRQKTLWYKSNIDDRHFETGIVV